MSVEPAEKRAIVFVDGQNLFHAVKEAFGYRHPNYDILKLASAIVGKQSWKLVRMQFYTGIPDVADDAFWHHFWSAKLAVMGRQGVRVFSRPLRYRNQTITLPDGTQHTQLVGQEKGVDIRIALDVVRAVMKGECDVAVMLSQDQDLSEVADEVRVLTAEQGRWVKLASAFPDSPTSRNRRGINKTIGCRLTGRLTTRALITGITGEWGERKVVRRALDLYLEREVHKVVETAKAITKKRRAK